MTWQVVCGIATIVLVALQGFHAIRLERANRALRARSVSDVARDSGYYSYDAAVGGRHVCVLMPREVPEAERSGILHGSAFFLRGVADALDEGCQECREKRALAALPPERRPN